SDDFILSAKNSDGTSLGITSYGNPFIDDPATTDVNYFYLSANGTSTETFKLTEVVAGEYLGGQFINIQIVGVLPDNSEINSNVIYGDNSTVEETFTFDEAALGARSEEHTSELQSRENLVC